MNKLVVLASASPRRKALLADTAIPFRVESIATDEFLDTALPIEQAIEQIAYEKANVVYEKYPDALVIGADTIVCYEGKILGKPIDREDAYRMLTLLSGKTHTVISGVAIIGSGIREVFHEVSEVSFYELEEELLQRYLATTEAYDKAGAYGIQGFGKLFVRGIHGDYYNVMGLPIAKVYRILKKYL